jgi:hypothetical protein
MDNQTIEQMVTESQNRYNKRLIFIKRCNEKKYTLKESIVLSKFWYNITFNKCKYNKEIYEKIKKIQN